MFKQIFRRFIFIQAWAYSTQYIKMQEATKPKNRLYLFLLFNITAISMFASDMYVAALPEIVFDFSMKESKAQWISSFYFIGVGLSQLVYGPISEYRGRKPILNLGLFIFCIGSFLCFISTTFSLFLFGRCIQGCGSGAAICIPRSMLRDQYKGSELSRALSYIGMGLAIVPAIAPILGGYIQHYFNWRSEFLFMFLIASILILLSQFKIQESNIHTKKFSSAIKIYKNIVIDPVFFLNVILSSLVVANIVIFYNTSTFYLQNTLGWSEVRYSKISLLIALFLLIGRRLNIALSKKFSRFILLFGSLLSLLSTITMFFFQWFYPNYAIGLLIPVSIYTLSGGVIFANTFVGASEGYSKWPGFVSSLYGFIQMMCVALLMLTSSLMQLSPVSSFSIILFLSSILSVFSAVFLFCRSKSKLVKQYPFAGIN